MKGRQEKNRQDSGVSVPFFFMGITGVMSMLSQFFNAVLPSTVVMQRSQ
ncbi:MAG: hypothetical protein OFPI_10910 [Osedax symbiont Rs2]|nr:MAG: hypothetical protein OFPI_10910 [Osedax symbiont Rs2]